MDCKLEELTVENSSENEFYENENIPQHVFDFSEKEFEEDVTQQLIKRQKEISKPDYHSSMNERIRSIVVKWLLEVCFDRAESNAEKFEAFEVWFRTIHFMDQYFGKKKIHNNRVQLLGCVCYLLACKMILSTYPSYDMLVYYSAGAFEEKDLLPMEFDVLNTLNFSMTPTTFYDFIVRLNYDEDLRLVILKSYSISLSWDRTAHIDYRCGLLPYDFLSQDFDMKKGKYLDSDSENED